MCYIFLLLAIILLVRCYDKEDNIPKIRVTFEDIKDVFQVLVRLLVYFWESGR